MLDPRYGELFFTLGMFIHGFGVTARGLTWFSNTLKDGFGYLVGTQNHVRPTIWGIVLYFGDVYPWVWGHCQGSNLVFQYPEGWFWIVNCNPKPS